MSEVLESDTNRTERMQLRKLATKIGHKYYDCIIDDSWVFRQIDSVRITNMGSTRRHTSLDALASDRLPAWPHGDFEEPTAEVGKHIATPIALIQKGVLDRLDVTIEGKPATILTTEQNIEASRILLFHLIQKIKNETPGLSAPKIQYLENACLEATSKPGRQRDGKDSSSPKGLDPPIANRISEAVEGVHVPPGGVKLLGQLASLTETLSTHFMLIAVAPTALRGKRISIKFAFDFKDLVPKPSKFTSMLAPTKIEHTPTTFFESCSYHFELDLPAELRITRAAQDESPISLDRPKSRIHLTWPSIPASDVRETLLSRDRKIELQVAPAEQGIRRVAALSTTLTLLFTLLAVAELIFDFIVRDDFSIPSPSASILLASQAILLSWLARSPENRLVESTLKPLRIFISADAVIIFFIASLLAVPLEAVLWKLGWVLASLGSLKVFSLYLIWRHANPLPSPDRLKVQSEAPHTDYSAQGASFAGQASEV